MPTVKAMELSRHLGHVEPAPAYAVVGEDDALAARSMHALEQFSAPPEQPGSSVRRFEGLPEPRDVFGELRTVPFLGMAGRRAAVVEDGDAFLKAHADALASYLAKPSRMGSLILRATRLDMRTKAAKALAEAGTIVDCSGLTWREAETWLRAEAARLGKKLAGRTAAALVEAVGPNLLALESELQKLALYAGERASITEEDVDELAVRGRSRSVFDLGAAVARGDAADALRLCGELLLRGEAKESVIAVLARQVRQYWEIRRLRRKGQDERAISRSLGLPGFVVSRAAPVADRLSDDWFAARLQMLCEADCEMKTTSLRASEEEVWLEALVAKLCGR